MLKQTYLMTFVLILVCVAFAPAAIINFTVNLDGAQANAGAGVPTPGTGSGWVKLDTTADTLDWSITFQDLIGDVTNAHFHGPALPNQNAGVVLGIVPYSGLASPFLASGVAIAEAGQQHFLDGLIYVNIHTTTYPGGEIRGQVVPEPMTLGLIGLGGLVVLRRRNAH